MCVCMCVVCVWVGVCVMLNAGTNFLCSIAMTFLIHVLKIHLPLRP